jgi:GTP cyclohydrolase I
MNRIQDENETIAKIAEHYRSIIELLGENPDREGLVKTPLRAAKALYYATSGYRMNADDVMSQAIFEYSGSKMVVVKDIEFYSLCEHHILPFFGKVSIGYIPTDAMIGLSKLARVVNVFARRLQVQERFTAEVCQAVYKTLHAKGVIVVCNADHLCMKMRGVEKQDSSTTTVEYSGEFENNVVLREEFFRSLKV